VPSETVVETLECSAPAELLSRACSGKVRTGEEKPRHCPSRPDSGLHRPPPLLPAPPTRAPGHLLGVPWSARGVVIFGWVLRVTWKCSCFLFSAENDWRAQLPHVLLPEATYRRRTKLTAPSLLPAPSLGPVLATGTSGISDTGSLLLHCPPWPVVPFKPWPARLMAPGTPVPRPMTMYVLCDGLATPPLPT